MNKAKKILELWQSGDSKNHLLAIELLESLELHQMVNHLINDFDLEEIPFLEDNTPDSFFRYQGKFQETSSQFILQALDQVRLQHAFSEKLMRKAFNLIINIMYEIFPLTRAVHKGNLFFGIHHQSLWVGLHWQINPLQQPNLSKQLAKIKQEKDKQPFDFINYSTDGYNMFEEEATLAWQDITRKLRGHNLWYYFDFLPQKQCMFYFLVELKDEKSGPNNPLDKTKH